MFYIVQQSRCHIAALFQFFSKPTLLFHILYDCFLLYEQHGMVWYNRYNNYYDFNWTAQCNHFLAKHCTINKLRLYALFI